MASANPANPQTFNRYAYTLNNPLNYTDPSGLDPVWVTNGKDYRVFLTDEAYNNFLNSDDVMNWAPVAAGAHFHLDHLAAGSDAEWYQRNVGLEGRDVFTGADGNFHPMPDCAYCEEFLPAMQQQAAAIEPWARGGLIYMSLFTLPVGGAGELTSLGLEETTSASIAYKIGAPVAQESGYEWSLLSYEERAYEVANKYGINLQGRSLVFDETLGAGQYGMTSGENPMVLRLGREAFSSEEELAGTIAHELRHGRAFLGSGSNLEPAARASEKALIEYIRGLR